MDIATDGSLRNTQNTMKLKNNFQNYMELFANALNAEK